MKISWQNWSWIGASVTLVLSTIVLVADTRDALEAFEPFLPASHGYVQDATDAVTAVIENANDRSTATIQKTLQDLSDQLLRVQISQMRTTLQQLKTQQPQMADLLNRNPDSQLLKNQSQELDDNVASTTRIIAALVCELNKRMGAVNAC